MGETWLKFRFFKTSIAQIIDGPYRVRFLLPKGKHGIRYKILYIIYHKFALNGALNV